MSTLPSLVSGCWLSIVADILYVRTLDFADELNKTVARGSSGGSTEFGLTNRGQNVALAYGWFDDEVHGELDGITSERRGARTRGWG